jgi:hypothetical protein
MPIQHEPAKQAKHGSLTAPCKTKIIEDALGGRDLSTVSGEDVLAARLFYLKQKKDSSGSPFIYPGTLPNARPVAS